MAPLEPWEKVLVSKEFFDTDHGEIDCQDCHGPVQERNKPLSLEVALTMEDCMHCHETTQASNDCLACHR